MGKVARIPVLITILALFVFMVILGSGSLALVPVGQKSGAMQTTIQQTMIVGDAPKTWSLDYTPASIALASVAAVILLLAATTFFIKKNTKRILAGFGIFFIGVLIIGFTPVRLSAWYETQFECAACATLQLQQSDLQFQKSLQNVLDPLSFKHYEYINYFEVWGIHSFIAGQLAQSNFKASEYGIDQQNVVLSYQGHDYQPVIAYLGKDIVADEPLVPIPYLIAANFILVAAYFAVMMYRSKQANELREKLAKRAV